jgi:hypothetical protein
VEARAIDRVAMLDERAAVMLLLSVGPFKAMREATSNAIISKVSNGLSVEWVVEQTEISGKLCLASQQSRSRLKFWRFLTRRKEKATIPPSSGVFQIFIAQYRTFRDIF